MGALTEEEVATGIKGRVERNETNPIAKSFLQEEKQGIVGFQFEVCVDYERLCYPPIFFFLLCQDFVCIGVNYRPFL